MEQKRYPKDHFIGKGLAVGIAIGLVIGIAIDNTSTGIAVGIAIGLSIGYALEKKKNPNPILPTDEEKKKRNKYLIIALGIGAALLLGVIFLYLFN